MRETLLKVGYVANPAGSKDAAHVIGDYVSLEAGGDQIGGLICYCFQHTRDDIEQDFIQNGRSLIMEKIAAEKKVGGCDCANKNPKGR
jgi:hypothetical protein